MQRGLIPASRRFTRFPRLPKVLAGSCLGYFVGQYLYVYSADCTDRYSSIVYEVCPKSNLNMQIANKTKSVEDWELFIFNFSLHGYQWCDHTFSQLISLPEGCGNATFGDNSYYPLPILLKGLLGQCEASQLLLHYQDRGEVCPHQMKWIKWF